jgi:2-polyprenyl-6-methoxyphenol hydroxylase-like FAD-dependent oxidoreductase
MTAQGMTDAFRDAELCAGALDEWLAGRRPFDAAMEAYQSTRDARVGPMYEFTCQFASFTPPTPQMQQLFASMTGNQASMDGFAQVLAGVLSPVEFFSADGAATSH